MFGLTPHVRADGNTDAIQPHLVGIGHGGTLYQGDVVEPSLEDALVLDDVVLVSLVEVDRLVLAPPEVLEVDMLLLLCGHEQGLLRTEEPRGVSGFAIPRSSVQHEEGKSGFASHTPFL